MTQHFRMTAEEFAAHQSKFVAPPVSIRDKRSTSPGVAANQARSKYGNVPTIVDGKRFASRKEAKVYGELRLREQAGEILDLKCHTRYPIVVNNVLICEYEDDFSWIDGKTARREVADAKGCKTPAYRLKCKLMLALHGVAIVEL